MLAYQHRVDELVQFDPEPWNHRNLTKPPTVGLRDWRVQMDHHDVARFELLAVRPLARLSYPASGISATAGDRFQAARVSAAWYARRTLKRLDAMRRTALHADHSS